MKLINAADAYNSGPLRTGICEARNEASLNNPTPAFVSEIRLLSEKTTFKYLTDLKLRPRIASTAFSSVLRSRDLAKSLPLPNGRRAVSYTHLRAHET